MGEPVTLLGGCALSARIKPDALTRCLENLVSNAIKYGGGQRWNAAATAAHDHHRGRPWPRHPA
jgi:signal transduction histidine kinase